MFETVKYSWFSITNIIPGTSCSNMLPDLIPGSSIWCRFVTISCIFDTEAKWGGFRMQPDSCVCVHVFSYSTFLEFSASKICRRLGKSQAPPLSNRLATKIVGGLIPSLA